MRLSLLQMLRYSVIAQGAFGLILESAEVYDDDIYLLYNGDYSHDTKADHAAFAGLVYEMLTTGGAGDSKFQEAQ